jgi:hypothetical protein
MAKTLQFKRYITSVLANTTGAIGELIVDSNTNTITVHDGSKSGGWYTANAITLQAAFNQANAAATILPQNAQTSNYVLQLSDAGKHIYYTQASNTILYIPNAGQTAFQNGSTIMIVSQTTSNANVTITPNTGVSLYLAGNTTSASRNVTTYGVATLIRVAANTWFIQGTGIL